MSEDSHPSGCPCGRSHPPAGVRRKAKLRAARPKLDLVQEVYEAAIAAKAVDYGQGRFALKFAGSCESPIFVKSHSDGTRPVFVRYEVRCRRCKPCLRARTNYWGFAAMNMTLQGQEAGRRTWFGTLTLSPEWQRHFADLAFEDWVRQQPTGERPAWWDDQQCDERFRLVRQVLLPETQRFWKRLRKAGHRFKYFLVFERHKSGLPHMHFLLHEQDKPITKRELQAQWPFGHSNVSIVGGKARNAAAPEKAAWYVVKYLSKSYQSRQLASRLYVPQERR